LAGSRPGGRGTFGETRMRVFFVRQRRVPRGVCSLCEAKLRKHQKYPKQRRPCWLCPFAALRATCGARDERGLRKLASLKHAQPFFRPPLRSSAQPEGSTRDRTPPLGDRASTPSSAGGGQGWGPRQPSCRRRCPRSRSSPCGRAEQRRGVGIRNSHVRRPRSGQVGEFPPRREQRKEARRAPDFGSPFFWLLFFGEAKKSSSAAGPRPGQTQ